jgi:phosphoenolpyruvate-protein kinase (PTS system EI component)
MQAASIPQVRKAIVEYSSKDLTRLAKKALAAKKL